ncbi:MAG TPA: ATP-binding protein [Polyangia bacterium]|jgi:signal transduction histidine kinase
MKTRMIVAVVSAVSLGVGGAVVYRGPGVTAGVFAACLLGLGGFILYASRRAVNRRERLRRAAEIARLHDQPQEILDHIPTGVLALSASGITVAANRALRERMPPAALGAPLAEAFPEAPTATIHRLRALIEQTRASSRVQSLFGARLALFGEEAPYNVHVVPLAPRDPDTRFLLVLEDLGTARALESQLVRAEKLATVGTLAAGIAHEIGTPLGVVRGRAAYVLNKLGRDHAQAPGVQVIIDEIDHVAATLRQLLDVARVRPAVVRAVSVALVAQAVVDRLETEAQHRSVSLQLDVADLLPRVAADPEQLEQVLVNLVMNACDADEAGGHVTIRARTEDAAEPASWRRVRIDVVDDGRGIAPENRHQVFDPFFTTKKPGRGTGLGLAIAAQIVRNHGGEIDLESAPGHGTCVTVWWPTLPSEDQHDDTR